jgi:nuclear transcription Y subunit beta
MSTLGFEEYVEPLKVYLHKYRETEGEKGALINKSSGDSASGKKEGTGMMSPGVQMTQAGIYNPYMQSQMVSPVTYQAPHY